MSNTSPMPQFFLTQSKRLLWAALGLFLFSFGIYTQLAAGIGTAPWNVLTDGFSRISGLSFGNASIIISIVIVAIDVAMKEPIGVATLMDVFLIGWWVDMFLWLDLIPAPQTLPGQILLLLIGVLAICYGQYLYIKVGLSCGPRDALLVAVGKRFPKVPIGMVNIALMSLALIGGWLMGGVIGFGTIFTMFCTGFCMDLVFALLHFEPRLVHQEGLAETWAVLRTALTHSKEN